MEESIWNRFETRRKASRAFVRLARNGSTYFTYWNFMTLIVNDITSSISYHPYQLWFSTALGWEHLIPISGADSSTACPSLHFLLILSVPLAPPKSLQILLPWSRSWLKTLLMVGPPPSLLRYLRTLWTLSKSKITAMVLPQGIEACSADGTAPAKSGISMTSQRLVGSR